MRARGILFLSVVVATLGGCSSSVPPPAAKSSSAESSVTFETSDTTAQAESSETPSTPAGEPGAVRYLALGDSLTQGVGAPDEAAGAFPALLADKWRAEGCAVELKNIGVSGYTSKQILDEQVPQIAEFKPTIITFQAGGNDITNGVTVDEYRDNVDDVLDAATDSGARVIVLAMNEWYRSPSGAGYTTPEVVAEFDAAMIDQAQDDGAEFIDMRAIYKQQADDNQWVDDGLHPTPEAYRAWADELAAKVPAPCRA